MRESDPTRDGAREHTQLYGNFQRRTGKDFSYLQKLHSDALDAAVRGRTRLWGPPNIVACDPDMLVYLTEVALQHLAVGAAMQEVREQERFERLRSQQPSMDHGPWPGQRTI